MKPLPPVPMLLDALAAFAQEVALLLEQAQIDWQWRPDASAWSLAGVMCHLRDVEGEVHLPRYQAVISRDKPFLSGVDSDHWASARGYHVQSGREAALSFLDLRQQSLELLRGLSYEQWERTGTHAFFGTTSLHELVNLAVQHDEAHQQQISDLLAHAV